MRKNLKLLRSDSFKLYEWLKVKQPEIEQGKFTKSQLAQSAGESIGVLVGVSSLESTMLAIGIKFKSPINSNPHNQYTKLRELEARIANIEKQLGIANDPS